MNIAIAEIVKTYISTASFVDKIAGLVQTMKVTITDSDNGKVEKTYPVSCTETYEDCKNGKYAELIPNSKYKSIVYFEDMGVSFGEREGRFISVESRLKLVCWANLKLLDQADYDSANMIAEILYLLPSHPEQVGIYRNLSIEVNGQDVRNSGIFSKYTYNEFKTQYLMYPYDYFSLNLTISYKIIPQCYEPTDNPAPACP